MQCRKHKICKISNAFSAIQGAQISKFPGPLASQCFHVHVIPVSHMCLSLGQDTLRTSWHVSQIPPGGVVLPYMDYTGKCRSTEFGTNQHFCLKQGILFAIPTLKHGRRYFFAARITLQTHVVAVPARVSLQVFTPNTPLPIRRSTASHGFFSM